MDLITMKTAKGGRKISLPWFRQSSVTQSHAALSRQHTIDTPGSFRSYVGSKKLQVTWKKDFYYISIYFSVCLLIGEMHIDKIHFLLIMCILRFNVSLLSFIKIMHNSGWIIFCFSNKFKVYVCLCQCLFQTETWQKGSIEDTWGMYFYYSLFFFTFCCLFYYAVSLYY